MGKQDKDHHYEIFDNLSVNLDQEGDSAQNGYSRSDENPLIMQNYYTVYDPENTKEIVLKIIDYPNRIQDPFKIKIK